MMFSSLKFKKILVGVGYALPITFALLSIFLGSNVGALYTYAISYTSETINIAYAWSIIGLLGISIIITFISLFLLLTNKKVTVLSLVNSILYLVSLLLFILCKDLNIVYVIIGFLSSLLISIYTIIFEIKYKEKEIQNGEENKKEQGISSVFSIIISIISFVVLFSIFLIPVCFYDGNIYSSLINGLMNSVSLDFLISFISFFILYLLLLVYFAEILGTYKNAKKAIKKTRILIYLEFSLAIIFYIYTIGISYYVKNYVSPEASSITSIGYIPLIVIGVIAIINSIVSGKYIDEDKDEKEVNKSKKAFINKLIVLSFAVAFIALLVGSLFSNILIINYSYSSTNAIITVNGLDVLKNYQTMESGYQLLAYFIYIIIIYSIIALVINLSLFFRKSVYFYKASLVNVIVSCSLLFVLSLFGKYYEIVKSIQLETINKIIESKGFDITVSYESTVTSQTIYFAIAGLIILAALAIIRPYSKKIKEDALEVKLDGDSKIETGSKNNLEGKESANHNDINNKEEKVNDFDPCPAFSEIDSYEEKYIEDFNARKNKLFMNPTLPSITNFIVEYAKNSRLHLSYKDEDIAQFIAGLGSSRLTILQGMSGTGKTSLPKIFSEAILGNCEIVEVESSWKDKNELIGFYNEFSSRFTPKKFTQSLYRAKFNPEIITFIVLDEMNLSRIEYYFSDFLSLMENEEDKREFKLLNIQLKVSKDGELIQYKKLENGHTIKIPTNVWFIGTANRDESTFEISDKVYDRAMTMNFAKRAPKIKDFKEPLDQKLLTYEQFIKLINESKEKYKFDCENNEIVKEVERIVAPFNISFGNRILNQIEFFVSVYCSCFSNPKDKENEALEKILLTKVVQKLETKSIENKEELVHSFEKLGLFRCSEFISKLNEDI